MSIFLGNLSIDQMQKRLGINLTPEEIALFAETRCTNAKIDGKRKWHCFDIPLFLSVGSMDFATELMEVLKPHSKDMKEPLQIGIDEYKEGC